MPDRAARIATGARIWFLSAGFGLFVPVGLLAKQSMATSFVVLAVLLLIAGAVSNPRALVPDKSLAAIFVILAIYTTATHLFVISCAECSEKLVAKLAMLGLVLWIASSGAGLVRRDDRDKIGLALTAGLAIAVILLVFELSTDAGFYRMITGRESDPDVPLFRYNRGTTALVLLSWPAAGWLWSRGRRIFAALLVALSLGAAAYGESASALVSGLLAVCVFSSALFAPIVTLVAGLLLTGAFTVLAPWLLFNLLGWMRPFADAIPPSILDRMEIWNHAARAVLDAPVFGNGIGAIRSLAIPDLTVSGYRYLVKPPTHPHDAALQVWLELGGIGVVLFAAMVWVIARMLRSLDSPWRAAGIAVSAGAIFTSMVSYGLWQETWLGMIGMTALAFRVFAAPARD
jgi:exopolysaccharide production protein ExoQ